MKTVNTPTLKIFSFSNVICLLIILGIAGCEHKDDSADEIDVKIPSSTELVKFMHVTPADSASYSAGETVFIYAEMESDSILHGYDVYLINLSNGDTVFSENKHTHGNNIYIEEEWVNEVPENTTVKVEFNIRVSHEGNHRSKVVNIFCQAG